MFKHQNNINIGVNNRLLPFDLVTNPNINKVGLSQNQVRSIQRGGVKTVVSPLHNSLLTVTKQLTQYL